MATTKEQKINLVKSSVKLHRLKGTPTAIEMVMDALQFNGDVQEWFEYDGRPYYFRLITEDRLTPDTNIEALVAMVNEFKNVRSWLENITVHRKLDLGLNIGTVYPSYQQTKILLPAFKMEDLSSVVSTGLVNTGYRVSKLGLKPFEMEDSSTMDMQNGLVQANYKKTKVTLPHFAMESSMSVPTLFGGAFSAYKKTTIMARWS